MDSREGFTILFPVAATHFVHRSILRRNNGRSNFYSRLGNKIHTAFSFQEDLILEEHCDRFLGMLNVTNPSWWLGGRYPKLLLYHLLKCHHHESR